MTAEIAVLNRYAVALAADSAVTIGDGSTTKIFQTENKLFQLSEDQPIGIMLYNATSHYGIPWELIIKDFREKNKQLKVDLLFDIVPRFLDFLQVSYLPSADQQSRYIRLSLIETFVEVRNEFSERIFRQSFQKMGKRRANDVARSLFNSALDEAIAGRCIWDKIDDSQLSNALADLARYEDAFDSAFEKAFKGLPLQDQEKTKVRELAARTIVSTRPDEFTTGIVFAGFGSKELFPSLCCVEIYGVVSDRLIKMDLENVDIDRASNTGAVIPFAQREAADSLLYGRSDLYEFSVVQHFDDVISQIGNAIVDASTRPGKRRNDLRQKVIDVKNDAIGRFNKSVAPQIKRDLSQDILDTVRHMPKQELASFAEALVSVTSIKRKISVGPETVGGPIDVAVISRHEGFVWVKRKLYFPSELNPRFTRRMRRAQDADKGRDAGITDSGPPAVADGNDTQPS